MSFVTFGEIMMRLTTPDHQVLRETNQFNISFGGAEANVAIGLSGFGIQTAFVTGLPDNAFGEKAIRKLKKYDVDTTHVLIKDGRLGTYFVEEGFELRQTKVIYDRKDSVYSLLTIDDLDLETIFKDKTWFHFSGVTPAINSEMHELMLEVVKFAHRKNIKISCDLNYRASLWDFEQARKKMTEFLPYVDVLFGYEPLLLLDEQGNDKKDGLDRNESIERLMPILKEIQEKYDISYIAFTQRKIFNSSRNRLQGFMFNNNKIYETSQYDISILDRVGTGDAYTAGILYGLMQYEDLQSVVDFGINNMMYKHTIRGDYNFIDADTIQSITKTNKEINR